jgi:diguanylate cyclase (GGDEF)-like protein
MRETPRILIVEDEEEVRGAFADALRRWGYEVLEAGLGREALRKAQTLRQRGLDIHVVMLDLELPDYGLSLPLIEQLRRFHPRARFLPSSSRFGTEGNEAIDEALRKYDIHDFFEKPMRLFQLECALKRAIWAYETARQADEYRLSLIDVNQQRRLVEKESARKTRALQASLYRAKLARLGTERISEQIIEAGHKLLGARDIGELLRLAVEAIHAVVPAEAAVVYFRKSLESGTDTDGILPHGELSRLIHKLHLRGGNVDEAMLERVGVRFANDVAATGQALNLPAPSSDPSHRLMSHRDLDADVDSLLSVPLGCEDRGVIGVIQVFNRLTEGGRVRAHGFSDADVRVLAEIASFVARGVLSYHEVGHDPLTRLHNRRVLLQRTEIEIKRLNHPSRAGDFETWFGLIDIDHFKRYNDISGYLVADGVLQEVAAVLQKSLREHDFVARFGGEEFCLILTRIESREQAFSVLDRIRQTISRIPCPNMDKMPMRSITVSIGASRMQAEDVFEAAFERANLALKLAKVTRNTVTLEEPRKAKKSRKKPKAEE